MFSERGQKVKGVNGTKPQLAAEEDCPRNTSESPEAIPKDREGDLNQ
jgi:hypothetical protein